MPRRRVRGGDLERTVGDGSRLAKQLIEPLLGNGFRGPVRQRRVRERREGYLVPLAEQDRTFWDVDKIAEGVALITKALPRGAAGPYQLQAATAAIHDETPSAEETDWPQIKALDELMLQISENPIVALNHARRSRHGRWPTSGLQRLETLATDKQLLTITGCTRYAPTSWR
jgi:predicted RNA polymerase sigma factor